MYDYREKITQAESNATKIVEELVKLKDAVKEHQTSTETIKGISAKLEPLIDKLQSVADAQLTQIKAINNLRFDELVKIMNGNYKKDRNYLIWIIVLILLLAYINVSLLLAR